MLLLGLVLVLGFIGDHALAHGPHVHPLTKLSHAIHNLRVSDSIVPHEAVEWDDREGVRLSRSRDSDPAPAVEAQGAPKSPPTLPPVLLASNCSKAPGFSGPGPMYCNVTWSGVLYPAEDDLVALWVRG